jgi:hypothetical protein
VSGFSVGLLAFIRALFSLYRSEVENIQDRSYALGRLFEHGFDLHADCLWKTSEFWENSEV